MKKPEVTIRIGGKTIEKIPKGAQLYLIRNKPEGMCFARNCKEAGCPYDQDERGGSMGCCDMIITDLLALVERLQTRENRLKLALALEQEKVIAALDKLGAMEKEATP